MLSYSIYVINCVHLDFLIKSSLLFLVEKHSRFFIQSLFDSSQVLQVLIYRRKTQTGWLNVCRPVQGIKLTKCCFRAERTKGNTWKPKQLDKMWSAAFCGSFSALGVHWNHLAKEMWREGTRKALSGQEYCSGRELLWRKEKERVAVKRNQDDTAAWGGGDSEKVGGGQWSKRWGGQTWAYTAEWAELLYWPILILPFSLEDQQCVAVGVTANTKTETAQNKHKQACRPTVTHQSKAAFKSTVWFSDRLAHTYSQNRS